MRADSVDFRYSSSQLLNSVSLGLGLSQLFLTAAFLTLVSVMSIMLSLFLDLVWFDDRDVGLAVENAEFALPLLSWMSSPLEGITGYGKLLRVRKLGALNPKYNCAHPASSRSSAESKVAIYRNWAAYRIKTQEYLERT